MVRETRFDVNKQMMCKLMRGKCQDDDILLC